jgi:hypothetical protein
MIFSIFDDCVDLAGTPTCQTNQFQCRSTGVCINRQLVCDGYPHNQECIDNSQAEPNQTLCNGRFQCRNGRCIPLSYKCDGGSSIEFQNIFDFDFHR